MSAPNTTIVGNLTADPDTRVTSGEHALTRLRVAVNRRVRQGERWEDRLDGFFTVVLWREAARNAAASLKKGDRVVVIGRLRHRTYETAAEEGAPAERRQVLEIDADEVAASLRFDRWSKHEQRPLAEVDGVATDADAHAGADADAEADPAVAAAA